MKNTISLYLKKKEDWIPLLLLGLFAIIGIFINPEALVESKNINAADLAWLIVASCLVFLMTPGLSFFYGGMVNRKNVISTILQSFIATGLISIVWIIVGFSLAFGPSFHGLIGDPTKYFFFKNVTENQPWDLAPGIPLLLFALFQLKFAMIAPALVVGAVAERINFKAYLLFMLLFTLFIYAPIAHWTWNPEGILYKLGVLDFAGGMVVHIPAGCAALVGALFLKQRKSRLYKKMTHPANIPFVLLGTSLLWFGWFGFNAGSSFGANKLAVYAFATTNTAIAVAGLTWIFFDSICGRKPSAVGFCVGAVVGMVAITPAAGYVGIPQSFFIGFISAIISNLAVYWKNKSSVDDTLDVFPCHGIGAITGMLLTGVFASTNINAAGENGLAYGSYFLFIHQILGLFLVLIYSIVMSLIIFKVVNWAYPMRVSEKDEEIGLDISQHNEIYQPLDIPHHINMFKTESLKES
ncbi:MAG: ammonium transporter [Chitinophagales bacterium]|nr:ammonium transporter [Chitinophagales bacterium]